MFDGFAGKLKLKLFGIRRLLSFDIAGRFLGL
jgi:hypothetical protein